MASVMIDISDEVLEKLKNGTGDAGEAVRQAAAFFLCGRGELSTSQAARLAGMTYSGFLDAAVRSQIVLYPVDLDELEAEANLGFTLGRQRLAGHSAKQSESN